MLQAEAIGSLHEDSGELDRPWRAALMFPGGPTIRGANETEGRFLWLEYG